MTSLFLALFAAWGWFCLVMCSDEWDAPITAAILLPVALPLVIVFSVIASAATNLNDAIKAACAAVANFERGLS